MITYSIKYTALQEATGLDTPEVTVATLKDSTSQKFAETLISKAKLILTNSCEEAIDLLLKGKIDVIVADYYFCSLTAYRYQDKGLISGRSPLMGNQRPLDHPGPGGRIFVQADDSAVSEFKYRFFERSCDQIGGQ
jgi:ABC-type amino acid transport substrate-binding protein